MTPRIRTRAAVVPITTVALSFTPTPVHAQPTDYLSGGSTTVVDFFAAIRGQIAALVDGSFLVGTDTGLVMAAADWGGLMAVLGALCLVVMGLAALMKV